MTLKIVGLTLLNDKINLTYINVVREYLCGFKVKICGFLLQFANLFGVRVNTL